MSLICDLKTLKSHLNINQHRVFFLKFNPLLNGFVINTQLKTVILTKILII
jgi:hypothetical protein